MIHTKIARILGPTRVVLAAGAEQGIKEGMEFIIYELSDPISDPETNESLGRLELHKGRVRVIHVQEKLSTATTLPKKVYQPSFLEATVPFIPREGRWVEGYERLPIDESEATPEEPDLKVRIGDLVRSVS
jgi:hypothetical protein